MLPAVARSGNAQQQRQRNAEFGCVDVCAGLLHATNRGPRPAGAVCRRRYKPGRRSGGNSTGVKRNPARSRYSSARARSAGCSSAAASSAVTHRWT